MQKLKPLALAAALAVTATPVLACDAAKKEAMKEARTAALAEADTDGDGALNATEFAAFHDAMESQREQRHFARLDADGNGQVTSEELDNAPPRHKPRD